jgi:CelD/BcsL family acetyltransferase involved in cellulose biosynthesis
VVDIAHQAAINPASAKDAATTRALVPLTAIEAGQWRALAQRAIEPNGYYLPGWELAVSATAHGRTGAQALRAFDGASTRLIGLMPVISLWQACKIPLPALVSAHPYGTLCSPLIDRDAAVEATTRLLQQAREAGAHALVLNDVALDGAAMHSLSQVFNHDGLKPKILSSYIRASLDATQDGETLLREALGTRKLKELRRQRHRLEEHGPVVFDVARKPDEIRAALETFLQLEASGWKGMRWPRTQAMRSSSAAPCPPSPRPRNARSSPCAPARPRSPPASCCATRTAPSSSSWASTNALQNIRRAYSSRST